MDRIFPFGAKIQWATIDGKKHTGIVRNVSNRCQHIVKEDETGEIVIVPAGCGTRVSKKKEKK
jgi:hypothetical protein